MFMPNQTAELRPRTGRNRDGEETYGESREIGISIVALARQAVKSSVRSDSSGSRGAAEIMTSDGKILSTEEPSVDDRITIRDVPYRVIGLHPRLTVMGQFDHNEIILELLSA